MYASFPDDFDICALYADIIINKMPDLGLDNTRSLRLQHPLNLWSLHGYVEWLIRWNKHAEAAAAQARLNLAMAHADVPIHAACYCRGETSCCD